MTVVAQTYQPEIMTEYVIRGNSAIMKCSIPSYIAEFVTVEAWIREDGEVYLPEQQRPGTGVDQGTKLEMQFTVLCVLNKEKSILKIPLFLLFSLWLE